MGLFSSFLGAIGSLFGGLFGGGGGDGVISDAVSMAAIEAAYAKFNAAYEETEADWTKTNLEVSPYAQITDDRYAALLEAGYTQVPAIDLYNGEYMEKVSQLNDQVTSSLSSLKEEADSAYDEMHEDPNLADATRIDALTDEVKALKKSMHEELAPTSTEIQTFLREPTSEIKAAEIWDAKFVKAAVEHIPPHYPGFKYTTGDPMSEVMRAYRMYEETNAYQLIGFGSQEAINAMYEAYMEGQDPYAYIDRIMNLIAGDAEDGSDYNEFSDVIVPDADGFGGSFLF